MTDKDPKEGCLEIDQSCSDDLNAKIGVLTRREAEARILAPVIDALGRQFGNAKVLASVRETIIQIAANQGVELAGQMDGNSLQHLAKSLQYWTRDNALAIEIVEQDEQVFFFNVTRCRYAELYEKLGITELGVLFSCTRDFALIEGFNPDISLKRTQTIMEGAAYCDFRYTL